MKRKQCISILIFILGNEIALQDSFYCYVYLIESVVSKLDQLSRDLVYLPASIVNFSLKMLRRRRITYEYKCLVLHQHLTERPLYAVKMMQTFLNNILLKRSLESVARISLHYRLQTLADCEGVDRSRYNFQRMFPA